MFVYVGIPVGQLCGPMSVGSYNYIIIYILLLLLVFNFFKS